MISPIELSQLKAFSRQDGLLLAALWSVSFLLVMYSPDSVMGNVLALMTPFFMGWRLAVYRHQVLQGALSYRRALAYCLYMSMAAVLAFALVQYVYLRFLDHGQFAQLLNGALIVMEQVYEQQGMDISELRSGAAEMFKTAPMQWVFVLMMQNFFLSMLLSLLVAAFGCGKGQKPGEA